MERNICEKFLNLISDAHDVRYPVSLSSRLFVFLHMDTSIYLSLCYFRDSCFSGIRFIYFFFLFLEEAAKLVRGRRGRGGRGRLGRGPARAGSLEDVGKRETPPRKRKKKREKEQRKRTMESLK